MTALNMLLLLLLLPLNGHFPDESGSAGSLSPALALESNIWGLLE